MSPSPLDPRLLKLLQAVVEEHVQTAQPVGSQALVERYGLDVSSATVRNWFVTLDEAGYLQQPHTSGGRVPTEAGYRLYVETAGRKRPLPKRQQQALDEAAARTADPGLRLKHLARAVADLTELGVFVRFAAFDSYYTGLSQLFAQPEFRDWQRVVSLSEVLDRLDEALQVLPPPTVPGPCILIGQEGPFGSSCSTVYLDRDGVFIGLLGPVRMDYARAHAALTYVSTLVS